MFRVFCFVCFYEGRVAQLVEQRTENPCVGGSIPPPATILFLFGMTPLLQGRHFFWRIGLGDTAQGDEEFAVAVTALDG